MFTRTNVVVGLCGAIVLAIGAGIAYRVGVTQTRPKPVNRGVDKEHVERLVREAHQQDVKATSVLIDTSTPVIAAPVSAPTAATREQSQRTAEAISAQIAANNVVDAALSRREWSDDDRRKLDVALNKMDPADRKEVILWVITAINAGELHVKVRGAPF